MNKEFMLLNDNTIEITNENGEEVNRGEFKNNNVKSILLVENKIEIIDTFKKSFDKEIIENNKVINLATNMLKMQVVLIVGLPLFGFINGVITNPSTWIISGLSEYIYAFTGAIVPVTIATIVWGIVRTKYKKIKTRMETMINKIEEMKKESEKELELEKEKIDSKTLEPLVKASLEKETNVIAIQMTKELINRAEETISKKGKMRIRKR